MPESNIQPIPKEQLGTGEEQIQVDLMYEGPNAKKKFRKENTKQQQEATKNHEPYCFRCAQLDFQEKQRTLWERKGTSTGATTEEEVPININLNEYSKKSRFKLLDKTEIIENKIIDGLKTPITTGEYENYQCKERGCRITIQKPLTRDK